MKSKSNLLRSFIGTMVFGGLIPGHLMAADIQQTIPNMMNDKPIVQIQPDGSKLIQDSEGSTVQIKPDGSKIVRRPDGTSIEIMPDGSKVIKKADGTRIEVSPGK